jgi:hypothetical protein
MAEGTKVKASDGGVKGGPAISVADSRKDPTWWSTPVGSKTPLALLSSFR